MTEIVLSQTPPILHGPTEKEKKYDRQLRLWAASGQAALESANVLLFNSGSGTVGVETLKNLVLPGIGKFTIVDDSVVKEADLGVNFFLDADSLGKSRAKCCSELLQELNPEVESDWFPKNGEPTRLGELLATSQLFTLIIYTFPISQEDLAVIEAYGQQHKTPLISIHSAGFYSYFRINLPGTFPIVDTHPEPEKTTDLRLLKPWPELQQFADEMTKDIDSLDDHKHGHLPYVVILLHYLDEWRKAHGGANPIAYKDKVAFRKMVSEHARITAAGGEENFDEAVAAANKNIVEPKLEQSVRDVFDHRPTEEAELRSSFWLIADAIHDFYNKHGCLPLPGGLPDMKAESNIYVQLQNIYKAKARKDVAEVVDLVKSRPGGSEIDPSEVELFCKNAAFVRLINATGRSQDLANILVQERAKDEEAELTLEATGGAVKMPTSLLPIYLALAATSHRPTASADEILAEITGRLPSAADDPKILQAAQEVARAGGGELHNISAWTGGMVAQETIKIITKQYVPIDNTCIVDGISSRSQVMRL